ncbi:hypothetical protein G9A89_006247 [Geosiphon pyriformis]|nr:hypothetical protein G9A89_006247 [Geosiphon pyriformis]
MNTPNESTVLSSVHSLTSLLKAVQKDWGLHSHKGENPHDSKETLTDSSNAIHSLGPVNLAKLSADFSNNINLLRSILKSCRDVIIPEASNYDQPEGVMRKLINLLKEEAQISSTLLDLQESISECKGLLLDACTDSIQDPKLVNKQIMRIAKEFGNETFFEKHENPEFSTLTIIGKVIVLDIDFNKRSYAINKARISYHYEIHQVDDLLTNLLQSKNIKLFRKNFEVLNRLDEFCKNHSPIDFFQCLKCITSDIYSIYERESSFENDISRIMVQGHGIPISNVELMGPSIAYWAPRYLMLETNWDMIKGILGQGIGYESLTKFYRLWITMEDSHSINEFLALDSPQYLLHDDQTEELNLSYDIITDDTSTVLPDPLKFKNPKKGTTPSAPVHFVARLEPPVYVTDSTARIIGNYASIRSRGNILSGLYEKRDTDTMSLEQLLIKDVIPNPTLSVLLTALSPGVRWETQFDQQYIQSYCLENLFLTNAKKIDRVPFTHISHLYAIMKVLRQQLTFNTLFQSIFNSSSYRSSSDYQHTAETMFEENIINIKVVTEEPPKQISVSFEIPDTKQSLTLQILILSQDAQPYVIFQGESSEFDRKMTLVLQTCQNIPMLVRWVLNAFIGTGIGNEIGEDIATGIEPSVELAAPLEDNLMDIEIVDAFSVE